MKTPDTCEQCKSKNITKGHFDESTRIKCNTCHHIQVLPSRRQTSVFTGVKND